MDISSRELQDWRGSVGEQNLACKNGEYGPCIMPLFVHMHRSFGRLKRPLAESARELRPGQYQQDSIAYEFFLN